MVPAPRWRVTRSWWWSGKVGWSAPSITKPASAIIARSASPDCPWLVGSHRAPRPASIAANGDPAHRPPTTTTSNTSIATSPSWPAPHHQCPYEYHRAPDTFSIERRNVLSPWRLRHCDGTAVSPPSAHAVTEHVRCPLFHARAPLLLWRLRIRITVLAASMSSCRRPSASPTRIPVLANSSIRNRSRNRAHESVIRAAGCSANLLNPLRRPASSAPRRVRPPPRHSPVGPCRAAS